MILLTLAWAGGSGPSEPPVERVRSFSFTRDDGLAVVVLHRPKARTVSVISVVDGGMVGEPRDGLAHSLADAWFASLPDGERTVQSLYGLLGAEAGVEVEPDATVFWAHGSVASLRGLLELEALRFVDPLRGLEALAAPSRPTHRRRFSSHYFEPVFGVVYPKSHPYQRLWRHPSQDAYFEEAVAFAQRSWTPSRTTLLVAGPMPPQDLICELDRSRCGTPMVAEELAAPLTLPHAAEVEFRPVPKPRFPDIGPLGAGVVDPVVLLAWSLPGTDSAGYGAVEFATTFVERALREEQRPKGVEGSPSCMLLAGRVNSTFVCVLNAVPSLDLRRWRRRLKKGWRVDSLERRTAAWRHRQLAKLMGSTDDPRTFDRMALERHRGGPPTVHGGALERLAFAPEDVTDVLERFLSERRMVVVRLLPE